MPDAPKVEITVNSADLIEVLQAISSPHAQEYLVGENAKLNLGQDSAIKRLFESYYAQLSTRQVEEQAAE